MLSTSILSDSPPVNADKSRPATRVLVIALDGAEQSLIREWIESGDLPNLRRMRESGFWCPLHSMPGVGDDGVWQTIVSGQSIGTHGRYHYMVPTSESYDPKFSLELGLAEPVFWRPLADSGRQVAILDVPKTAIVDAEGCLQLRNWGAHGAHGPGPETKPPGALDGIVEEAPHGPCSDVFSPTNAAGMAAFRDHVGTWIERQERLTLEVMDRQDWDLVFTAFSAAHCAGHALWHSVDPDHARYDADAIAEAGEAPLKSVYKALDDSVGRLRARAGPDAKVVVFTPLGMGPNSAGNDYLDAFLRARDAQLDGLTGKLRDLRQRAAYAADGLARLAKTGSWRTPQWLKSWRAHRNRRAYFLEHNEISGAIRINVIGREILGRVRRGSEYDALCDSLTEDLLALTDPVHGEPVVEQVVRPPREYPGPNSDFLPDLLVLWRRDCRINGLVSPRWGRFDFPVKQRRSGGHMPDGILFATGPGIARGSGPAAELVDLAPTVTALCGVSLPSTDGKPILLQA